MAVQNPKHDTNPKGNCWWTVGPTPAAPPAPQPSAMDAQVGGDHYSKLPIQPMRYSMENGLDACQHAVVKYVTRFRDKGGIEDLEKAKHVIDMLIEFERKRLDGLDTPGDA